MMRLLSHHNARTRANMRQCTGCEHESVQCFPLCEQKTGIGILWHFFVHSMPVNRINTSALGVNNAVHWNTPCSHFCEHSVNTRVNILCPTNSTRKGADAWQAVP